MSKIRPVVMIVLDSREKFLSIWRYPTIYRCLMFIKPFVISDLVEKIIAILEAAILLTNIVIG